MVRVNYEVLTASCCGKKVPTDLVQLMTVTIGGVTTCQPLCIICALRKRNDLHGIRKGTPFDGPNANAMFKKLVRYLIRTRQRPPKWAMKTAGLWGKKSP